MTDSASPLLRAVLASERSPLDVEQLGLVIDTDDARASMMITYPTPNPPIVTFSLCELATGLLRAQHVEDPALWGAVVLMVSSFEFEDLDSDDGQRLLEGLHDISNGEQFTRETMEVVHRLAARA